MANIGRLVRLSAVRERRQIRRICLHHQPRESLRPRRRSHVFSTLVSQHPGKRSPATPSRQLRHVGDTFGEAVEHHPRPINSARIDQLNALLKCPPRVHDHGAAQPFRQREPLAKRRPLPGENLRGFRRVLRQMKPIQPNLPQRHRPRLLSFPKILHLRHGRCPFSIDRTRMQPHGIADQARLPVLSRERAIERPVFGRRPDRHHGLHARRLSAGQRIGQHRSALARKRFQVGVGVDQSHKN